MGERRISVEKEFGLRGWTVRMDGVFIADFYREVSARRMAMNLATALKPQPVPDPR